jgi:hypothetical protein
VEVSPLHVGTGTGSSRPTVAAPAYFDLDRINLDSTTPAMMAPAITRIVVRSLFIDYPFFIRSLAKNLSYSMNSGGRKSLPK